MPESVRLLLVGSNEAVRRGLELVLSGEADIEIVGRADDAESAIGLGRDLAPSTILIDLESLGEHALEKAAQLRTLSQANVVVLSLRDDLESRRRANEAGVRFVSKLPRNGDLVALLRERPLGWPSRLEEGT